MTKELEALECLEKLKGIEISSMPFSDEYGTQEVDLNDIRKVGSQLNTDFREYTDTIQQALIKAQEQEKVLEIVFEKRIDLESFYITFIENDYDYNYYEKMYGTYGKYKLTKEEFDLLKRWVE